MVASKKVIIETYGVEAIRLMIYQVSRDYNGIPDIRSLAIEELQFFYDGLIPELTRPSK